MHKKNPIRLVMVASQLTQQGKYPLTLRYATSRLVC